MVYAASTVFQLLILLFLVKFYNSYPFFVPWWLNCYDFCFHRNDKNSQLSVIPAKAGIQSLDAVLDSRSPIGVEDKLRGNDKGSLRQTFLQR